MQFMCSAVQWLAIVGVGSCFRRWKLILLLGGRELVGLFSLWERTSLYTVAFSVARVRGELLKSILGKLPGFHPGNRLRLSQFLFAIESFSL